MKSEEPMDLPSKKTRLAIIAGGEGRRLGGKTKCLLQVGGRSILEQSINKYSSPSGQIILNVNRTEERLEQIAASGTIRLIKDQAHYTTLGPLGGVASVLQALSKEEPTTGIGLITIPGDCPFLPLDLIEKLTDAARDNPKQIVCAKSQNREHYMTAYWPFSSQPQIMSFLKSGQRAVRHLLMQIGYLSIEFNAINLNGKQVDPFFNINTPEDLEYANHLAQQAKHALNQSP